ncbi:hypothetical protein [Streptomyces sp. NPDC048340]|uniref:hypothetical protein n=1 Tax=Streptomyces sp. NPDC048340 TaxID=3365537 RepID=UPI00371D853C
MHAFTHIRIHAARTAELAAEAAEWHLAHESAPTAPALRDRLGEVLVAAGIRLMQPAHVHARIHQRTT